MEKEIGWLLQEKYPHYQKFGVRASIGKLPKAAKKDIERLKAGEPLEHLIGFVEFLDCKILANKDALIPRAETEYWVGEVVEKIYPKFKSFQNTDIKVLDMFAGSGCIGISIAVSLRSLGEGGCGIHTTFADSEKAALRQIEKNCVLNKISKNRYKIIQSDVFLNIEGTFDYIFANPPYIPTTRKDKIQESVLKYEPHAALFGGKDGLFFIRKFLAPAKNFLTENGQIFMEFDSIQKKQIEAMLKKYGYTSWEFHKDQYGKWRWVIVDN